jgi:hypothetical protein
VWQIEESYPLPESCFGQSSAFHLDSGHVFATCATSRTLWEIVDGDGTWTWKAEPECADGLSIAEAFIYRAEPIDLLP